MRARNTWISGLNHLWGLEELQGLSVSFITTSLISGGSVFLVRYSFYLQTVAYPQ